MLIHVYKSFWSFVFEPVMYYRWLVTFCSQTTLICQLSGGDSFGENVIQGTTRCAPVCTQGLCLSTPPPPPHTHIHTYTHTYILLHMHKPQANPGKNCRVLWATLPRGTAYSKDLRSPQGCYGTPADSSLGLCRLRRHWHRWTGGREGFHHPGFWPCHGGIDTHTTHPGSLFLWAYQVSTWYCEWSPQAQIPQ